MRGRSLSGFLNFVNFFARSPDLLTKM